MIVCELSHLLLPISCGNLHINAAGAKIFSSWSSKTEFCDITRLRTCDRIMIVWQFSHMLLPINFGNLQTSATGAKVFPSWSYKTEFCGITRLRKFGRIKNVYQDYDCSANFEYKNYIVVLLYKRSTRDAQLTALGRSLKIMNVRLLHYERLPRLRTFDKVQNVGSNMGVGCHVFRALDLLNWVLWHNWITNVRRSTRTLTAFTVARSSLANLWTVAMFWPSNFCICLLRHNSSGFSLLPPNLGQLLQLSLPCSWCGLSFSATGAMFSKLNFWHKVRHDFERSTGLWSFDRITNVWSNMKVPQDYERSTKLGTFKDYYSHGFPNST